MNLIIDIGNTAAKIAITENGKIITSTCLSGMYIRDIEEMSRKYKSIKSAIISSTRKDNGELECYVKSKFPQAIIFDHTVPTPLKNLYATPETLGMDRLAAAVGAWSIAPNEELLVFDFGTAITVERVTAQGEYLGGNIAPGLKMRFEALNKFTGKLPLVKIEDVQTGGKFGTNTTEAIWNGVIRGIEYEIEGYINQNHGAKLFFTGGDAKYFVKCRENAIFADSQLVIKGLERIIEYNAEKQNN